MNSTVIISYLLIFGGIVAWGLLLPRGKKVSPTITEATAIFGGAFLLASCFINLVPHLFAHGFATPHHHIKLGASVLVGFLIQLVLEYATHGVEHGHDHCSTEHCHDDHGHQHSPSHHPIVGLMIGLSIHAFLEGMPLFDNHGDTHQSLLYGIILHNIPISIVLVGLFMSNGYSKLKSTILLSLFAIMTPLGSLCNIFVFSGNDTVQSAIMGIVVGILLHVSVSILFDEEHKHLTWWKLALIIIAFTAAYFTPGCPEIY
ncbi:MAG: ZIP family metal transporter [Bacteroidales bacterium]|nr:ZIP family metal transporter [Bacteroidales bacterium]